jgi:hypothetical protein
MFVLRNVLQVIVVRYWHLVLYFRQLLTPAAGLTS